MADSFVGTDTPTINRGQVRRTGGRSEERIERDLDQRLRGFKLVYVRKGAISDCPGGHGNFFALMCPLMNARDIYLSLSLFLSFLFVFLHPRRRLACDTRRINVARFVRAHL